MSGHEVLLYAKDFIVFIESIPMPKRKKSIPDMTVDAEPPFHQPTDKLFKKVFEQPQVMQELMESQLPPHILNTIDFSTLKLEKGSFITPHTHLKI